MVQAILSQRPKYSSSQRSNTKKNTRGHQDHKRSSKKPSNSRTSKVTKRKSPRRKHSYSTDEDGTVEKSTISGSTNGLRSKHSVSFDQEHNSVASYSVIRSISERQIKRNQLSRTSQSKSSSHEHTDRRRRHHRRHPRRREERDHHSSGRHSRRRRGQSYESEEASSSSSTSYSSASAWYSDASSSSSSSSFSPSESRDDDTQLQHVLSRDTADNSQSRLVEDLGQVVRASDLSDYSDQFSMDSCEQQEFEDFMTKHDKGILVNVKAPDSEEEADSITYSLVDETSIKEAVMVNGSIVAIQSTDSGGAGFNTCIYRTFFCLDHESVQGSYGGLRNGEVLLASSTLSSRNSQEEDEEDDDDDDDEEDQTTITTWTSVAKEKSGLHSRKAALEPNKVQVDAIIEASMLEPGVEMSASMCSDDANSVKAQQSCLSSLFCWGSTPTAAPTKEDKETPCETTSVVGNAGVELIKLDGTLANNASTRSRTVVWERSFDEGDNHDDDDDSAQASIDEDRAKEIAQKARKDNILSKFKSEREPVIRPKQESAAAAAAFTPLETPPSSLHSTFLLGDNVEVSAVTEVEAGNGDTAFLIFLQASRKELSREGKTLVAEMRSSSSLEETNGQRKSRSMYHTETDKASEATILLVDNDERTDDPNIVREGHQSSASLMLDCKADLYLESLGQLSEASYYCLDSRTKSTVAQLLQTKSIDEQVQLASTMSHDTQASGAVALQTSKDGAQYIFCMRPLDLTAYERAPMEEYHCVRTPAPRLPPRDKTKSITIKRRSKETVSREKAAAAAAVDAPLVKKANYDRPFDEKTERLARSIALEDEDESASLPKEIPALTVPVDERLIHSKKIGPRLDTAPATTTSTKAALARASRRRRTKKTTDATLRPAAAAAEIVSSPEPVSIYVELNQVDTCLESSRTFKVKSPLPTTKELFLSAAGSRSVDQAEVDKYFESLVQQHPEKPNKLTTSLTNATSGVVANTRMEEPTEASNRDSASAIPDISTMTPAATASAMSTTTTTPNATAAATSISRTTVKAHALLLSSKKAGVRRRGSRALARPFPPVLTVPMTMPSTTEAPPPPLQDEGSSSSYKASQSSHNSTSRRSQDDSLTGTQYLRATTTTTPGKTKTDSSSSSTHSMGISKYLTYLDHKDHDMGDDDDNDDDDDDRYDDYEDSRDEDDWDGSTLSRDKGEKTVLEAKAILNNLKHRIEDEEDTYDFTKVFPLDHGDEGLDHSYYYHQHQHERQQRRDDTEIASVVPMHPQPIPTHIARIPPMPYSEMSSSQRMLLPFAMQEVALGDDLTIVDDQSPNPSSASGARRARTASFSSNSDEFFDAVSQNSSNLSVD